MARNTTGGSRGAQEEHERPNPQKSNRGKLALECGLLGLRNQELQKRYHCDATRGTGERAEDRVVTVGGWSVPVGMWRVYESVFSMLASI